MTVQQDARDATGSVAVFEDIWQRYLAEGGEPEFNAQQLLFADRKFEALLEILPPAPATVLECGSGSGEVSAYLAKRGYQVTLLDDSASALEFARRRFGREGLDGEFVKGNVYELPFADGAFDVVTSFGLLEHFRDVDKVIAEMARVIRPGGLFFADIVTERFSIQTIGHAFNGLVRVAYYSLKGSPKTGFIEARKLFKPDFYENSYSAHEYRTFISDAGIDDVELKGNRPFPVLTLPSVLEKVYTRLMKMSWGAWRRFDDAGSPLTNALGAGWWAWGRKR